MITFYARNLGRNLSPRLLASNRVNSLSKLKANMGSGRFPFCSLLIGTCHCELPTSIPRIDHFSLNLPFRLQLISFFIQPHAWAWDTPSEIDFVFSWPVMKKSFMRVAESQQAGFPFNKIENSQADLLLFFLSKNNCISKKKKSRTVCGLTNSLECYFALEFVLPLASGSPLNFFTRSRYCILLFYHLFPHIQRTAKWTGRRGAGGWNCRNVKRRDRTSSTIELERRQNLLHLLSYIWRRDRERERGRGLESEGERERRWKKTKEGWNRGRSVITRDWAIAFNIRASCVLVLSLSISFNTLARSSISILSHSLKKLFSSTQDV